METGEKIRKVRELRNFKQKIVADAIGVSQQYYSEMESGLAKVTIEHFLNIAKVLQVEPLNLLEFDIAPILNNHNQQGGQVINYVHNNQAAAEHLQKINELLTEIINPTWPFCVIMC
jgi:transcriptional regulator with XRE-family HTH domain